MSSASVPISTTSLPYDNGTMPDAQREADRQAYYAAYDVMTGVRIAATLGGFFGLMVILVVYKSKSKTEKALEDPHVQAVALAEAEEEERQIAAALEQTVYEQLNPAGAAVIAAAAAARASFSSGSGSGRRIRHSLDTCHSSDRVAPGWIRQTKRFSSVGGYTSLLEPPIRIHKTSIGGGGMLCSSSIIDEDSPPVTMAEDGMEVERSCYEDVSTYFNGRNLYVPRRASNITCSSTGSAYLERRGSNILQFTPVPTIRSPSQQHHPHGGNRRRQSSPVALGGQPPQRVQPYRLCAQSTICSDDGDNNTIDIRVIQPTPGGSPCGSVHLAEDGRVGVEQGAEVAPHRRLAPLASISSCNSSTFDPTITDASTPPQRRQPRTSRLGSNTSSTTDYYYYPDMDLLATEDTTDTDTVFRDMDCLCHDDDDVADADTDDEVDTFSTDSGDVAGACSCQQRLLPSPPPRTQPLLSSNRQQRQYQPPVGVRRYSTSHHATQTNSHTTPNRDFLAEFTSSCTRMIDAASSSTTCHHCHQEVELPSPVHERTALMSTAKREGYEQCPSCSSPLLMDEERLWTQETLF